MEGEADVGEQNSCTPFINHPSLVFLPPRKPFGTLTPTTGKAGAQTARAGRGRAGGRLVAVLVLMIMVGVVAMYWVKYRSKERRPAQVSIHVPLNPDVPLTCLPGDPKPLGPPGLPSYQEALEASGVHDAPPPPYPRAPSSSAQPH
ncbi:transmembrane gamma-carboxyglutamic acid protein 2 isoform X2 [Chelonia mydas]|uniref:transmembrane gamma-carboxyglutamic acid protein 2 isoform X2 n=1 Tax=Chelonia mydas TaxID=8469 RepID=UPI001CA7FA04|nr:transmembrane gamma-carboxyglutamic acid protein 2 isoform X2 [Chelonia mydas]